MSRSTKQALIGFGAILVVLVAVVLIAMSGARERGLRADVLSTRRAQPGEAVDITISVRDNYGAVKRVEVDFGDGRSADPVVRDPSAACRSEFADTESFDFSHTYTGQGVVTVRATVISGGCGAKDERVEAIRSIDIKPLRR